LIGLLFSTDCRRGGEQGGEGVVCRPVDWPGHSTVSQLSVNRQSTGGHASVNWRWTGSFLCWAQRHSSEKKGPP